MLSLIMLLNSVHQLMRKIRFIRLLILVFLGFILVGCEAVELGENEVRIRESASVLEGTNYEDVVEQLQVWGFTNIETVAVYDIIWGITKEGTTKSVKIGGSVTFKSGDIYDKDVSVVVTYSMLASDDPTEKKYTITWQYEDGTVIKTEDILWGRIPNYTGNTPVKDSLNEIRYVFSGWTPELAEVIGEQTYTALFLEEENDFTIRWKNHDGTVLEVDDNTKYGTIPAYNGEIPTKDADNEYTYVFDKWSPVVYAADKEQEYTAQFTAVLITFTLESAKKVVQVALTNYMAPDTLDDSGNYIDRSKFHPYSYSGSYKLTLTSAGTWTYLGEDTWYVSNMRFRSWFSSTTYYIVYAKVTYNGEYYMISEAYNGRTDGQRIDYEFNYDYRITQELIDN